MPPLRRDSFKDLDDRRSRSVSHVSRSVSRVSSRDLSSRRPNPPPEPERPPPPPAPKTSPLRPRVKAAPAFLKQSTSTSTVLPPVTRHHLYRLRGLQDLRVLIDQLQLEPWEHQAKRLLGESESSASILLEVVRDLKPRSNATQGQEPNHGRPQEQAGPTPDVTGIVLLEFLSHRILRPACRDRSG